MSSDLRHAAPSPSTPRPTPPSPRPVGAALGRAAALVVGFLLIVAGVVLGLAMWSAAAHEVTETSTTHRGIDRVDLDLQAVGDVEVRVHADDEVVVHRRIESTRGGPEVDASATDGVLSVTSTTCGGAWFLLVDRCSASVVLVVPAGTELSGTAAHGDLSIDGVAAAVGLLTRHGDVAASNLRGDVHLQTHHGDVHLATVDGSVTLRTRHGDVEVVGVTGGVDVASRHGNLHVRDGVGDLQLETAHGDIDVRGRQVEQASLTTSHGNVAFAAPSAPRSVQVRTSQGDVDVRVPADAPPYAVETTGTDDVDVTIATDPIADHRLDLETRHGTIAVGHPSS